MILPNIWNVIKFHGCKPPTRYSTQVIIQVIRLIRRIFRKTIRVHRWKILRDFEGSIVMGIHKIAGWFILENPTKMDDKT